MDYTKRYVTCSNGNSRGGTLMKMFSNTFLVLVLIFCPFSSRPVSANLQTELFDIAKQTAIQLLIEWQLKSDDNAKVPDQELINNMHELQEKMSKLEKKLPSSEINNVKQIVDVLEAGKLDEKSILLIREALAKIDQHNSLSAKETADSLFMKQKKRNPKLSNSQWWSFVCLAIDMVYDRKIAESEPNAVGKAAGGNRVGEKMWLSILETTTEDIHSDELKKHKVGAMPSGKIKKSILSACVEYR